MHYIVCISDWLDESLVCWMHSASWLISHWGIWHGSLLTSERTGRQPDFTVTLRTDRCDMSQIPNTHTYTYMQLYMWSFDHVLPTAPLLVHVCLHMCLCTNLYRLHVPFALIMVHQMIFHQFMSPFQTWTCVIITYMMLQYF